MTLGPETACRSDAARASRAPSLRAVALAISLIGFASSCGGSSTNNDPRSTAGAGAGGAATTGVGGAATGGRGGSEGAGMSSSGSNAAGSGGRGGTSSGSGGAEGAGRGGMSAGRGAGGSPANGGRSGAGAAGIPASGSGGTSNGGTGAGAAGKPGMGGLGGRSGGSSGGSAGAVPTAGAGNSWLCTDNYDGPDAGPHADGPEPITTPCASIPDDTLLELYQNKDEAFRVPQGLFYEQRKANFVSAAPCSDSPAATRSAGDAAGLGTFTAAYETKWFYEAAYCDTNGVRQLYRNVRCDYYDGMTFAGRSDSDVAFLGSLLWWFDDNAGLAGAKILGYSAVVGDATDVITLCTMRVVYGDFGLCDQITVESTPYSFFQAKTVTTGTPQIVKTLAGNCH